MDEQYKLILYNNTFYKEVELLPVSNQVRIGTSIDCDVRLKKDFFHVDFYIELSKHDGAWHMVCSPDIYIDSGDIRKLIGLSLKHGDEAAIRHLSTDSEIFKISFTIDFDNGEREYNCSIDLSAKNQLSIGSARNCDIYIRSSFVRDDRLELRYINTTLKLYIIKTTYGLYYNGIKLSPHVKELQINSYDFFSLASFYFYFKDSKLYMDMSDSISFSNLNPAVKTYNNACHYPLFNRNTRIKLVIPNTPIPVLAPPEKPEKPKNNLLLSIMPAVVMLILTIVIRGMMSGSSSYFVIFSACTIGMGIITSIITFIQGKKEFKAKLETRACTYKDYIEQKRKEITEVRRIEKELSERIFPNLQQCLNNVMSFSGELFDRVSDDKDFLCVRLGTGAVEALRKVQYKNEERFVSDDDLTYYPQRLAEEFCYIQDAPVIIDLKDANAIGIVGDNQSHYAMAKNITLDLVVRHYYGDMRLVFIMNEQQKEEFQWVRLLPHIYSGDSGGREIACDPDSRTVLFEHLYKEFSWRKEHIKDGQFENIVLLVLDDMSIKSHPLSRFIENASLIKVTFIFFENKKELLPLGCSYIVSVSAYSGTVVKTCDENSKIDFTYRPTDNSLAERAAFMLAPVYCEDVNLENSLIKSISLYDILNIFSPEDLDLDKRWSQSRVHESMAAPLGVKTKNEAVYLDIHEKAHGPHGLVAGTTGSGKSELLQSYILSMSTLYHPYEVGFMVIDFKGGGMANQFERLPHMLGTITNIDGKAINRSLLSIKAELLKRQEYFAKAEVNHIDKYILKYKNNEVSIPLPHLIIIVDEFAELKAEFPEFMKELVSTARIGRSLGVHLILATQKPSGQVNEQIWSNSRFKLCLKVQTPEDSNEMIKSPLASEIIEPGRAYFQVGNNEIFELFQSGYSGAPEKGLAESFSVKEYKIASVQFSGKKEIVFKQTKKQEAFQDRTQLEAIVSYVAEYCRFRDIKTLPDICLPPLPKILNYHISDEEISTYEITVEIGLIDDPNRQKQEAATLNVSLENTLIIGSSLYGKTNLLQVIIRELAWKYSPLDVNIYILDFGSMILKNFEKLNHMGGIVCAADDEKFKNLFRLLSAEISQRKIILADAGVSSFIAYREAGKRDLPLIVLMVDNFTAVKELYLLEEDPLIYICREGLSVGISVIISNSQTSGLGYRYISNFAKRIVLYCNEASEYTSVIDRCRTAPSNTAGRAITEVNKEILELQTYLSFEGEREIDRVNRMQDFNEECNNKYPYQYAKKIPEIPSVLNQESFIREYALTGENSYEVPVGLSYETVTPVIINLLQIGMFSIIGRTGSGKSNLLEVILNHLYTNMFTSPAEVYLVDNLERALKKYEKLGIVKEYSIDPEDVIVYIEEIFDNLQERYEQLALESKDRIQELPLKLLIVQNQTAIEILCKDTNAMKKYKELLGRLKALKFCMILSDIENIAISYGAPEILKSVKEDKNFFFFDDLQNLKVCDLTKAIQQLYKKKISLGDCYWLNGNEIQKIKTVKYGK